MALDSTYFGNGMVLILAIAVIIFIILFFAFKLDKEHNILKLFCFIFAIFLLTLIPKAAIDYSGECVVLTDNATQVTNATWHYDYISTCYANNNSTQTSLFTTVMWFLRLFVAYMIIFATWKFLQQSGIFIKRFK